MSDQPDHDREGSDSDENDVFVDQQDGEVADGDEVYDLEGDGTGPKPYCFLYRPSTPGWAKRMTIPICRKDGRGLRE